MKTVYYNPVPEHIEAAKNVKGIVSGISNICRGRGLTYKGFKWRYNDE